MTEKVYLNDGLIDAAHAAVGVSNPALLHGVGLFETLRTYAGRLFRLDEHINRLERSAEHFDMPVGDVIRAIPEAVRAVLEANQLNSARVRITVTPPGTSEGDDRGTLIVSAQETEGYPAGLYERGMAVCLCTRWRQSIQDPLAGHKTTSYFSRLLALRHAQACGCGEALWFTPQNRLAEGCCSNVFFIKQERLRTPPLETPVLPGITRAAVLEMAREAGLEVEEVECTVDELLDADEVFLTNAVMELMPVTRVEKRGIGSEKPGPITRSLSQAYTRLTRGN